MISNLIHLLIINLVVIVSKSSSAFYATVPESPKEYEVAFVTVVFRHGDNIPQELYPNDPNKREPFYPMDLGKLTEAGKLRSYNFGTKLRFLYKDLLGDTYLPHMVMGRSTNVTRTKNSLRLVLNSLYPSVHQEICNRSSEMKSIPINYVNVKKDFLLAVVSCPLYVEELIKVENLPHIQAQIEKFRPLMANLSQWTEKKINSITELLFLHHTLISEYSMGLALPAWAHDIFPFGALYDATVLKLQTLSYNLKLRRLFNGVLLKHIIDTMSGIVTHTIDNLPKIHLFCGHDTNIISLLSVFGNFEPHIPEYSSAVILELLRNRNNEYYVNIRHHLGIPSKMKVISISGCTMTPCPFNEFVYLMTDLMPIDEDIMCPKWEIP